MAELNIVFHHSHIHKKTIFTIVNDANRKVKNKNNPLIKKVIKNVFNT